MAIFSELGKKITQTTQSAVKSTKDMADIVKINSLITDEQKVLNNFFIQIGQRYYELYRDHNNDEFNQLCTSITECINRIADYKNSIQQIKGFHKCPICENDVLVSSTFCGTCGFDMRTLQNNENANKKCSSCYTDLSNDACFCAECGQRV